MEFTSETIPAGIIATLMIYTGVIWLVTRKVEIRMDSRIFAYTYILEGLVYAAVCRSLQGDVGASDFLSRLMVVMICTSQALPLTVSYYRSIRRGKQLDNT